jgi:hypothetical protein
VFACAASAGAHAGLVPAHLSEEPREGIAFLVAVLLLLGASAALLLRPADGRVAALVAILFAGLIVSYVASRTTGIPALAPDREPWDAVGLITNFVEAVGLALALWLAGVTGQPQRQSRIQEVPR